ncbi:hypothetical protein Y032_0028g1651 [Ancylostoma ceylanicum]|uniref:Uncharacterized protein n=1 Tax=Ancylostoma ceylanicum TaxID=53326 RepID=A0A016URM8_9BILA|nr:hypothetical protein Y032_0028g1651 [Ancylostoma ceylanicum]
MWNIFSTKKWTNTWENLWSSRAKFGKCNEWQTKISKLIKNQIGDFEKGRMYLHNGKKDESGSAETPKILAVKLTTQKHFGHFILDDLIY